VYQDMKSLTLKPVKILSYNKYSQIDSHDLRQICEWSDLSFGKACIEPDFLESQFEAATLLLVKENDDLLGACLLLSQDLESFPEQQIASNIQGPIKVLYRKFVLVNPLHRAKGISKILNDEIEKIARNYQIICSSIWQRNGIEKYEESLISTGYQAGSVIENYWAEDSKDRGFVCASCQKIPCKCSARIYFKINT